MNTIRAGKKGIRPGPGNAGAAIFFLLALILPSLFLLQPGPAQAAAGDTGIMPSSQVQAGMRGYGLTVFNGTRVESFPVVVVGRLRHGLGEADMILVRVLGGYPVVNRTGIVAGMSGSPIYINGRLIGAIGYGWAFSTQPIGGVTPIEFMLKDMDRGGDRKRAESPPPARECSLESPLVLDGKTYSRALVRHDFLSPGKAPEGTMVMSPVPAMMQVQGFSPATLKVLEEKLRPFGIVPLEIPGGARLPRRGNVDIRPGSAIGVTLVGGDLFLGGTGTVSYRAGERILAFAHPMMGVGSTDLPMHAAYIEGILPSLFRPFKLSSSLGVVGTLTQDRSYAISGRLGQKPASFPMTIRVEDVERKASRRFNLQMARFDALNPILAQVAGMEAVESSRSSHKKTTAAIKYSIKLKGFEKIEFEEYASGWDSGMELAGQIFGYFSAFSLNEFEPLQVERADLDIKIYPGQKVARIIDVSTQFQKVRPGDRMEVVATLKDQDGRVFQKKEKIAIPPDLKKGTIAIGVSGGRFCDAVEKKLRLKPVIPVNSRQIVDLVRKMERGNDLVFMASFPSDTLNYAGVPLRNLPLTRQHMLLSSPRGIVEKTPNSQRSSQRLPFYVTGSRIITVDVSGNFPSSQDGFEPGEGGGDDACQHVMSAAPAPVMAPPATLNFSGSLVSRSLAASSHNRPSPMAAPPAGNDKGVKKDVKKDVPTGSFQASLSNPTDFFKGFFKDTSINEGRITLGRVMETLYESKQAFVTAVIFDEPGDRFLIAESPGGSVMEIRPGNQPKVLGETGEVMVPCMAFDGSGSLFAGTGPNGRIFRMSPGGGLSLFATLKEDFIWDLKVEPSGSLLAACGNKGRVYRVDPSGRAKVIASMSEAHVTCLALAPGGVIYAGCGNEGTIYRLDPDGKVLPYYRTESPAVDSMIYLDGNLWIASGFLLYKVGGPDRCKVFFLPEHSVIKLASDGQGNVLAGTSDMGRVYRVDKKDGLEDLFETSINQVMDMAVLPNGDIVLASGNPGSLLRVKDSYAPRGSYLSKVIDTGGFSSFGNVRWLDHCPKGTGINVQTRSGNSSAPDETWSDWSIPCTMKEGQKVSSPPARFIQVKANLESTLQDITPVLYEVSVYFALQNRAPLLEFDNPRGGEKWSGTKEVKWSAYVANPQTLSFSLFYSGDGARTWKVVEENVDVSAGEIPPPAKPGEESKPVKMKLKWKTAKLAEGQYVLKLQGFDRTDPANPYLGATVISSPVIISNKEPEITIVSDEAQGRQVVVTGFVKTSLANVREVLFQVNNGEWQVAVPEDGIFDNTREKFKIFLNRPLPSRLGIKVKATDEAGNSGTAAKAITVKQEEEKKGAGEEGQDGDKS